MSNLKDCFEKDQIVGWKSKNVIRGLVRSCLMRDITVGYDIWLSYLHQLLDLKKIRIRLLVSL